MLYLLVFLFGGFMGMLVMALACIARDDSHG